MRADIFYCPAHMMTRWANVARNLDDEILFNYDVVWYVEMQILRTKLVFKQGVEAVLKR